jgi:ABC-type bacteriocin/lantibiotic exporter with double-glycine peptidase domain
LLPKPHIAPPYYPPVPHRDRTVVARPIRAYYQVRQYTCGYASALTVAHALHSTIAPAALYEALNTDHTGTRQTAIVQGLRSAGISANVRYDLGFDELRRVLDQGRLVIGYHHGLEHWIVIYGYGLSPERVFVADPLPANRSEHLWSRYGEKLRNFGIVCSSRRRRRTSEQAVLAL